MNLLEWYIPLGLLAFLLFLLLRRDAHKTDPYFFTYVVFGVAAGVARFFALGHPRPYYWTYWITEAGYDTLGILVMYEVFRAVLRSLIHNWWARLIFPSVLIVGIVLSLGRDHSSPSQFGHGLGFYIVAGEIAVRFVQVIMFAGLVTSVPLLGLRWRQYPFGIAAGFGVYSTVALLMTTKFSDFGTRFTFLWGWTLLVAYSVAVLIWIWFFSVPQKTDTPSSRLSAPSPGVLKQYIDVLRRMR